MTLSMNEVEATAKKAARGAGYPWGLAEEAAKAARWLCARGLDGCTALAGLLEQTDAVDVSRLSPVAEGDEWRAPGGTLCPLATGAAISDRAHELGAGELRVGPIAQPILLVPFAALLAVQIKGTVTVVASDGEAVTDRDQLDLRSDFPALAPMATIAIGGEIRDATRRYRRADPDPGTWDRLTRLAHRTYAPATEESRLKGAGAGLADND